MSDVTMNNSEINLLDASAVKRSRHRARDSYAKAAVVQHAIADSLLQRCQILKKIPQNILQIGTQDSYLADKLKKLYPDSHVTQVNIIQDSTDNKQDIFLNFNAEDNSLNEKIILENESFDLIISNLYLHWLDSPKQAVASWRSLLKKNGSLLFSTLGPDSLCELRQSFAAIDDLEHVHQFVDMHIIGDWLLAAGYTDPVMDVDRWRLTYSKLSQLFADLKNTGTQCALAGRTQHLYSKKKWQQMIANYKLKADSNGLLPATLEVVFGHAIASDKNQPHRHGDAAEVFVSLDSIRRR